MNSEEGAPLHDPDGGGSEVEFSLRRSAQVVSAVGAAALTVLTIWFLSLVIGAVRGGELASALSYAARLIASMFVGAILGRLAWTGQSERVDRLLLDWSRGRPNRTEVFPAASPEFNLATARAAAAAWDLESWAHRYLMGPGNNAAFSAGLWKQQRYWRGPVLVPLGHLIRTCGPEEDMPYREEQAAWDRRVLELQDTFTSIEDWPPLIVQYEEGRLLVRDGSHRYAALRALGLDRMWVILWYAGEGAYQRHADSGFAIGAVASGAGDEEASRERLGPSAISASGEELPEPSRGATTGKPST